jgi:hypothetical protein
MAKTNCPYCADPNLIDKILVPPAGTLYTQEPHPHLLRRGSHWPKPPKVKILSDSKHRLAQWGAIDPRVVVRLKTPEIVHGKYHIKTITDADMTPRYAGFQVQIIGVQSRTEPPAPLGPFFSRSQGERDGKPFYISFNAARITHKDSPIIVDTHWHPDHGRLVAVRGFAKIVTTPEEMAIISTALRFDIKRQHGAPPKIDLKELVRVIRAQGTEAVQKDVAAAIGVSTRTIREWLYFQAGMTWESFKGTVLSDSPAKRASGG